VRAHRWIDANFLTSSNSMERNLPRAAVTHKKVRLQRDQTARPMEKRAQ
jgi:hypothetical protein